MQEQSILISGIGIAGPTLAYWLGRNGFRPTLIESAPRLRSGGYVIDFWGLGYDIAERMGLRSALDSAGYDVREFRVVDGRGHRIGGFGVDVFRTITGGRYVSLPRSELSRLLYGKIDGRCESIFNDRITSIAQDDGGVDVTFQQGRPRRFDLVIGADGLHSAVRRLVFGAEKQFECYLGYFAAAFAVTGYPHRNEHTYVSFAVPGKQVSRFAMRDNCTMILFVYASERPPADPHDVQAHKALLHAQFGDAGWECPQLLTALDASDDVYFDPVSQIRLPTWSLGRVALVGDAAFCPSLLAGQGSALAMLAAYVLAGELGKTPLQPQAAFARYQDQLRPFLTAKQDAAQKFASWFAPRTRLGLLARNLSTRLLAVPSLARLMLGSSLLDRLDLPDYPLKRSGELPAP